MSIYLSDGCGGIVNTICAAVAVAATVVAITPTTAQQYQCALNEWRHKFLFLVLPKRKIHFRESFRKSSTSSTIFSFVEIFARILCHPGALFRILVLLLFHLAVSLCRRSLLLLALVHTHPINCSISVYLFDFFVPITLFAEIIYWF